MQSSYDEKNRTFNVPAVVEGEGEEEAPPQFSEEWTRPIMNGGEEHFVEEGTSSARAAEFPSVGERPIPNVSPMTAHVSPLCGEILI